MILTEPSDEALDSLIGDKVPNRESMMVEVVVGFWSWSWICGSELARVKVRRPPILLLSSAAVDDLLFKPEAPGNKTPLRAVGVSDDLLGVGATGLEDDEEGLAAAFFVGGGGDAFVR